MDCTRNIIQFLTAAGLTAVAYFEPILGVIFIFIAAFLIDFITGLLASFSKGERFKSSKARWSFAKLVCYTGSFAFMLFIAKNIRTLDASGSDYTLLLWVIKVSVYAGVWFEGMSITENLLVIMPQNRYIRFINYMLGVEFMKKIPGLSGYLKEEKEGKNG